MKIDFARIAQLPIDQRRDEALAAMNAKDITVNEAMALIRGENPRAADQVATGTVAYGQVAVKATDARPLAKNAALWGVNMARDLGEPGIMSGKAQVARQEIDKLLDRVEKTSGDARRLAVRTLQDYLGKVGPDVVDAIHVSNEIGDFGIGYVNSRLLAMGAGTTFEAIMDPQTRAAARLARPGELRGTTGSIRFAYEPYSDHTIQFLRSQGVTDQGKWGVTFEGMEAFAFRRQADGSVSANIRDLKRGVSGGSLDAVVGDFVKMLGDQALPPGGYAFEIDLTNIPRELHGQVKAALAGLKEYGAELKYFETDIEKIMDAARESNAIGRRIDQLLQKPQSAWTKADWAEYREVHAAYHALPARRFEQE
ncbi:hypothetical protein L6R52_10050 [Myxococcota bacterium]|nr:hypothetical protein [Myxococcota bacterium]